MAAPLPGPITPDCYLWGYFNLKDRVYSTNPRTITELKMRVTEEMATIPVKVLKDVVQNFAL